MKTFIKKLGKAFLVALGIFFSLLLASFILLLFFLSKGCTEEYLENVISPNQKHMAVVYLGECGMTTDFTTYVKIIKNKGDQTDGWSSGWSRNIVFLAKSRFNNVEVYWIDNKNLKVNYHLPEHNFLYKKKDVYRGITINYEENNDHTP